MAQSQPDATFGKYQILQRIASGSMAEIYKARLDGIGGFHRTFAIKRILPHLTAHTEFVEMLVEEAKVAGLLSHANIVQILDLGQVEGAYYIAMEFVHGPDLGRILRRCRDKGITLPVPHAVFICIEVLKGLEYAHDRQVLRGGRAVPLQIVHRDLTPGNILVSFQGEVKLTDFGIAKASIKALESYPGEIKGHFEYLSPEQARGEPLDRRSDIFALGIVLYEMLTGQHPFAHTRPTDTMAAIREGNYVHPSEVNPDIPFQLEVILEQALQPGTEARFQNATAMKDALDRFFHDAGFIFSHSTLAAYLKGLFPTDYRASVRPIDRAPARPPDPADQETRPLSRDEDTEERPTAIDQHPNNPPNLGPSPLFAMDTTLRNRPAFADDLLTGIDTGNSEESTVVEQDPTTGSGAWDEAETVIRRPASGQVPGGPESVERTQTHGEGFGHTPAPPDIDRPTLRPTMTDESNRATRPRTRQRRRQRVVASALVIVSLMVSFFIGVLLGYRAAFLTQPPIAHTPLQVKRKPQVLVNLPEGAVLKVNDREVPGTSPITVSLTPRRDHTIEVALPGHFPVETQVNLDHNDVHVMSFEVGQLHRRRK